MQSHKPADYQHTAPAYQHTAPAHRNNPNTGTCHSGNNTGENRFSTKVKEMASSVTKVFTEHKNQGNNGEKKDGHCFPRMGAGGDHNNKKKKEKHGMKTKKNNKDGRSGHSSSDSDD